MGMAVGKSLNGGLRQRNSSEPARSTPRVILLLITVFVLASAIMQQDKLVGLFGMLQQAVPGANTISLLAGIAVVAIALTFLLIWIYRWLTGGFDVLRAGEQHLFDAVTDALGDAMVVTDEAGRAIYSNAAYLKLASQAGASRLVGIDLLYSGYPDFSEPVYQLAQAATSRQAMQRDVRVAAGSSVPGASADSARWLRLTVSPLNDANFKGHTLWRLVDITADRHHQESAFSRLQFIITYLDHAPAGFFSTLADGKVDYINATLASWIGVDLVEAQGGALSLADLVGADAALQLSSLEPIVGGSHTESFSQNLMTRKGDVIPVTIIHRADFDADGNALPSRSMVLKEGQVGAAMVSVGADSLRQLAAASPIGVAQISDDGTVISANSEFLALSPKIKLRGRLTQALPQSDGAGLTTAIAEAARQPGKRVVAEAIFESTEPRAARLSFVRFGADGPTVVFAEDKTESKALEVQLAQSQKMQAVGQLASGIAHDFNNVLTPIIGFADLLLAKMRPQDSAFADIMNIKQNANRAAQLVRQLLAFSRKQTMQPKLHQLTEAMSDLGNLLGRVLGEKIELEIAHGRDLGFVLADIHQFEQVIINLAVNARDAMPKGGKLLVKTYNLSVEQSQTVKHPLPPAEYVVCEVSDTGSGIPKAILEKIWEPFFSTKDVGKGTGLGLSMVYGIVKQSSGFIYCDSEIGKGTTFTIFMPRHYPEKVTAVADVPTEKVEAKREDFTGRGRILVVEDEDSVRAFALRALQSRGYTVVEADSGESGLEAIENDKDGFELILSDVVMPEMDGPTMLAEIRKRGIKTKFIFMSGYAEDAFERNLENPDDFAFLQKPFSLKQLIEKVKDVMG
jgi:two-component system cell cycle sensor histidine kinase/response regulator CckA